MMINTSRGERHLTAKDGWCMIIVLIIYGILSFFHLGSMESPQTFWQAEDSTQQVILDLGQETKVSYLRELSGARFGKYQIAISNDNVNYSEIGELEQKKVFAWEDMQIDQSFRYLSITRGEKVGALGEIALYDKEGNKLPVVGMDEVSQLLVDEQGSVPDEISYMNTTYFDEIYHARTAYEYIHGMDIYEWTHPPLGKLIMTIPIRILGMTPFAYRIMGNIAGLMMLIVIFIFAKKMFKRTNYALLAMITFAADGMHFVQTRIGTVDSYLVLFIMLAYLFMYQYMCCDSDREAGKMHLNLLLSGFFMGCAIATKWNGAYTAIGLALLFFINFFKRNSVMSFSSKWRSHRVKIILGCFAYFIFIPVMIYVVSYIPDMIIDPEVGTLKGFWALQMKMYHYHADLEATHPFSSPWYLWPIGVKPLWYYDGKVAEGMISSITLHCNPFIWWTGILAMIYHFIKAITDRSKRYIFLSIGILAAYVPYMFIPRIMFIYHYFPVVPLMILAIVGTIKDIEENLQQTAWWKSYAVIAVIVFIFFYPIYSGLLIPAWYARLTEWFPIWQLSSVRYM